ncbi:hypothetical protein B0H12DRAFT_1134389 [Mycena haematopus]|nr:hypothetical protein B0H12DRAFT_1134389 [Mycena haematopus]
MPAILLPGCRSPVPRPRPRKRGRSERTLSRACGSSFRVCAWYWKLLSVVMWVHVMGCIIVRAGRCVVRVKSARTFVDDGFGPHTGKRVMPSRQSRNSSSCPARRLRGRDRRSIYG